MDLALKIGAFIISLIVVGLGFLKVFDKKLDILNKEIKENEVEIEKLKTTVDMLKENMWKQEDLERLIDRVASRSAEMAVDKFKIELLRLGIGAENRESGIKDI